MKNSKGYHIHFISNHDENSWSGTEFERMGAAHKVLAVLAFTFDGMPLLYSGQEEPLKRRLAFFDKDSIGWKDYVYAGFYQSLFDLKQKNKALGNGSAGVPLQKISIHREVYAFKKEKDGQQIVVILNLSNKNQSAVINQDLVAGREIFSGKTVEFKKDQKIMLKPWEYQVYSN